MTTPIRIDNALIREATLYGKAESRTASLQIAYWAKIGKAALKNPDLPIVFMNDDGTVLFKRNNKEEQAYMIGLAIPEKRALNKYDMYLFL